MEKLKKYTELTKKVFLSKKISKTKLKNLKTKYKKHLEANSIYKGEKLTLLRKIENLTKSHEAIQEENTNLKSQLTISQNESKLNRELINKLEQFFFTFTKSSALKNLQITERTSFWACFDATRSFEWISNKRAVF